MYFVLMLFTSKPVSIAADFSCLYATFKRSASVLKRATSSAKATYCIVLFNIVPPGFVSIFLHIGNFTLKKKVLFHFFEIRPEVCSNAN